MLQRQGVKRGQGLTLTHVIQAMIYRRLILLKDSSSLRLLRRVKNTRTTEVQGLDWRLVEHDWSQHGRRPITNHLELEYITASALRRGEETVGEDFYTTFLTQQMNTCRNAGATVLGSHKTPCKKTINKYMRVSASTQKPTVISMLLKAIQQVCVVSILDFSKAYESVVLADATNLCWWSGNCHFCVVLL
jgi:hypothetical protein